MASVFKALASVNDWANKRQDARREARSRTGPDGKALPATTASRFNSLGKVMIALGVIVLLFTWLHVSSRMDGINVDRIYRDSNADADTIRTHHIIEAIAALVAVAGLLLVFLAPRSAIAPSGDSESPQGPDESVAERLGRIQSLRDQGAISEDELRDQRKRILDSQ